jgi:hypothetical protein
MQKIKTTIPYTNAEAYLIYGNNVTGRIIELDSEIQQYIYHLMVCVNLVLLKRNIDYKIEDNKVILNKIISGDNDTNFVELFIPIED